MANVATKTTTATAPREVPVIPTSAIHRNGEDGLGAQGFTSRLLFVRPLPEGLTLQDLSDHADRIWTAVQGNQHSALKEFDRLIMVNWDRTWLVEAYVCHADRTKVRLAGIRKVELPVEAGHWENETARIEWAGSGFGIFIKKTGAMYGNLTFPTMEAAKHHFMTTYYAAQKVA